MKRICIILSMLITLLYIIPTQPVKAAKLSSASKVLYVGASCQLKVTGTKKKVMWRSSDSAVAVVKNGRVTAKSEGKAVITATVGPGAKSQKLKCKVTVKSRLCVAGVTFCDVDEFIELKADVHGQKADEFVSFAYAPGKIDIEIDDTGAYANYLKDGLTSVTVELSKGDPEGRYNVIETKTLTVVSGMAQNDAKMSPGKLQSIYEVYFLNGALNASDGTRYKPVVIYPDGQFDVAELRTAGIIY